jgi:hypothetical protein
MAQIYFRVMDNDAMLGVEAASFSREVDGSLVCLWSGVVLL